MQEIEGFIFGLKNREELPRGNFDYAHLQAIHRHFFYEIYEWAGKERTIDIAKGDSYFCHQQYITKELDKLFSKLKTDNYLREFSLNDFCKKLSFYFNEINAAHPFKKQGGFLEIHARFQRNEITSSDVCSILRYAKNSGATLQL